MVVVFWHHTFCFLRICSYWLEIWYLRRADAAAWWVKKQQNLRECCFSLLCCPQVATTRTEKRLIRVGFTGCRKTKDRFIVAVFLLWLFLSGNRSFYWSAHVKKNKQNMTCPWRTSSHLEGDWMCRSFVDPGSVPWLGIPQIWSVSQTPTPEPANSPRLSTSLLKSWTCGSSRLQAAVGVRGTFLVSHFLQVRRCLLMVFASTCRARGVQPLRCVQPLREHVGRPLHGLLQAPNAGGVALLQRHQVSSHGPTQPPLPHTCR